MSIIKKTIQAKGQDLNIKISLSSNNNLNGLQDSIDDFITEETGLSLNDVDDGEKDRFRINPASGVTFNFLFSTGYTTSGVEDTSGGTKNSTGLGTGTGGFFDAGFLANEVASLEEVFLSSFFIVQVYDTTDNRKQQLLHTGYFNGTNISRKGGLYDTDFLITPDDEFGDYYITNKYFDSATTSDAYMKFSFYNAKTGSLHIFQNQSLSGSTLESKLYFDIQITESGVGYKCWTVASSVTASEIASGSYVDQVNNTLDSFNNEKPTYPDGDLFVTDGTYITYTGSTS